MTSNDPGHIDNLSPEQEETLRTFWIDLATSLSSQPDPTTLTEELYLACAEHRPDTFVLRYLRARKWDVTKAVAMTVATLKWRLEFGVNEVLKEGERACDVADLESGKSYYGNGSDRDGRPVAYIHVALHDKNTVNHDLGKNQIVLTLETGRLLLQPPQEMATIVFDLTNFGMKNMDYEFLKFLLQCMQDFYPESLGKALVVNAPWVFNGCWVVIKPWIDPVVVSKIQFVKMDELPDFIDSAKLPQALGGDAVDYEYIPASEEDEKEFKRLRADTEGQEKAWKGFRGAYAAFEDATRLWAGGDTAKVGERKKAEKELRAAYDTLSPYIRTRTEAHRRGLLKDPAFPPHA
ncbi:phosphatidylinositol transfer protein CSR1 [Fimicolochytrium jonesii]|uniref:phosphatidylinositol transfer protein CSR1 n=1 Tax=Fimicolochytrium jonesii TaxID=1396493 RepID=UPI0022FDEF35|nr:phosphatidylinositol transfer protein CSR1 [Fimicolochytrium jonesii]KAI8822035.1 phosphatidylinositol transfer protein CSR1 [Fimicolochytrium jonesii]